MRRPQHGGRRLIRDTWPPANGILMITTSKTEAMYQSNIKSHNDRTGGFAALRRRFVAVLAMALMVISSAVAQSRTVSGTVVDTSGEPLIGANVKVVGTNMATITDIDGRFSLKAEPGQTLLVNYVGYLEKKVKADKTDIEIVMQEDANVLDDVVVVGYGVARKETLTGAVAAITNKEMTVTKNENVVNMLSGKLPGVRITQMSAQPGEFANKIDIRGMGSPLIVIDGIPRDQEYFSRMDANEIDQVSVLKDASAAIYGVRAANGVILVTTKHGGTATDGKVDVTFQANIGWQGFLYMPETADAVTHMLLINEKRYNGINENYPVRATPAYTYDQMFPYSSGAKQSTNWTKEMFKDYVPQQQYNLSLNGGSERINYFFNLGYLKQEGSYRSGSLNYDRWNFRANVDAKITNHLKANLQVGGYIDEKNQPMTLIWSVYKKAWTYRPTSEAYIDGDHSMPAYDTEMGEAENPVAATNSDISGYNREKRRSFNGQLSLTYEIPWVKGLNVKALYNYDYNTTDNSSFTRAYSLYRKEADGSLTTVKGNPTEPQVTRRTDPSHATLLNLSVNYNATFGDHTVGAMALFEETYSTWTNFWATRKMLLNSEYLFAGEEEDQVGKSDAVGDMTRRAWIGKVDYDYKRRYILNAAFRYDASSRYPKNGRWGFFPFVSVGWRLSEEAFMDFMRPVVDNLKIRASWGRLGDDNGASTYPATVVGYNLENNRYGWFYNGSLVTGVSPTAIPNPNWTWYVAQTYNLGVDFDLWHQMLAGSVEIFKRDRSGLPATSDRVLPNIVGATMPQENKEKDRTFGWEISLSHHNRIGEVNYYVTGQMSATKTRWIEVLQPSYNTSMQAWRDFNGRVPGRNTNIWATVEEGGRFGSWHDIAYHPIPTGQNTLPGDYWYEDWNGDGVINGEDAHPVATKGLPVFNYGFTIGADWKGIDISTNWQGAANVYNSYDEVFTEVGPFNGGAVLNMYTDRWHTANVDDDPWNPSTEWIPGLYPATGHSFNDWGSAIKNCSYLRLKTLEVGYTFPQKWMKKAGMSSLRIYFNAYNLWTISKMDNIDPERPGKEGSITDGNTGVLFYNYPVNRVFNIGITARF